MTLGAPGRVDWLLVLCVVYGSASLVHHVHNAVYLHAYPNMPVSLSVAGVGGAWCLTAVTGFAGYGLLRTGHALAGLCLLALYAALGLLGLAHYHLAPVAAHSIAMNATIGAEVATAVLLLIVIAREIVRRMSPPGGTAG